jgi:hypothetical protein
MLNNYMAQAWLLGRPLTPNIIAGKAPPPPKKEKPRLSRRGLSMEDGNRWAVSVEFEGNRIRLGSYSTLPTAAKARDRAEVQIAAGVFNPAPKPSKRRQYPARIVLGGQVHYLGTYDSREEAFAVCQQFKDNWLDKKYAT